MENEVIKLFKKAGISITEKDLEKPRDPKLGDISCTVAFDLAKKSKKSPKEIAEEIGSKLEPSGTIPQVNVVGPYINMFFDRQKAAEKMLRSTGKGKFEKRKKKVMVEYANVNTHKPIHIGHLRNVFLGESLSRILELYGYKVVRSYYINDYGMHVAKVLWYLMRHKTKVPKEKRSGWLGEIYAKAVKKLNENPELANEPKKVLKKMEEKDPKVMKLWKQTWKWSIDDFKKIFSELGSPKFDAETYEHQVFDVGKKISQKLVKKGIAEKSEGAVIVDLQKYGLGVCVLLKSDGTGLYSTADLELANKKFKEYGIDISIYVVGSEQKHYFKQIFKILELMGFKQAKNCYHLSYELVYLSGGKMSSREGTLITYRQLKGRMLEKALNEVRKRNKSIGKKRAKSIAEEVALAAMKYSFLRIENNKKIVFDWERAVEFEGETGPYLQYSAVRSKRILEKAKKRPKFSKIERDIEYQLIRKLHAFRDMVSDAAKRYAPHLVANYTMDIAKTFSEFYSRCKVVGSEYEASRLAIVRAYHQTISKCLHLLGIEIPERM